MANEIQDFEMSTNEELQHLQIGDNTATVIGAVVRADQRKLRANAPPPKTPLFRAILSNLQGSEIRLLFWEEMATKYQNCIVKMLVEIRRPRVVAANPAFKDRYQTLLPVELAISDNSNTEVIILGPMPETHVATAIPIQEILFQNIAAAEGQTIRVTGYVQSKFVRTTIGNVSYGSGAVTDGTYHLIVNITNFDQNNNPDEGIHVRLQGLVRRSRYETIVLQVVEMTDVVVVDNLIMSRRELRRGHAPIPEPAENGAKSLHQSHPPVGPQGAQNVQVATILPGATQVIANVVPGQIQIVEEVIIHPPGGQDVQDASFSQEDNENEFPPFVVGESTPFDEKNGKNLDQSQKAEALRKKMSEIAASLAELNEGKTKNSGTGTIRKRTLSNLGMDSDNESSGSGMSHPKRNFSEKSFKKSVYDLTGDSSDSEH